MSWFPTRPGERRDAWAAFFTLFALIASHAILETARDALFLARVPATHLPWVFLAVAALSFLLIRVQAASPGGRRALAIWTAIAAAITFAFFQLFHALGRAGVYALYVWSGVLTTLLLVHFWTLLGELFSVTQAKRLYGFIGSGSVLGAIAGSGAAGALSRVVAAETLLAVSAGGFAISALIPACFRPAAQAIRQTRASTSSSSSELGEYFRRSPYGRLVVLALFISTAALTIADFVFKSMVAELIPKAQLAELLGSFYFALNVVSLIVQLTLAGWVLRRFSLGAAMAILPAALALGGTAIAAGGGLFAVLALKGADGSLRYSLHRTATELLYLPFGDDARARLKAFIDIAGQRGGQVFASVSILALLALGGANILAPVLVVLALAWIAVAIALRKPYVELFRARLKSARFFHLTEFPELDVASLETLIAALDSRADREVLAALEVLEREKKAHLIPALILYHPTEEVVEHALAIFTRARRTNVVAVIDRLLDHPSPRVRAATIAARSVLAPDLQLLLERMKLETSEEVRATITVNLIASGHITGSEAQQRIEHFIAGGTKQTKIALAQAISRRGGAGFSELLAALSSDEDSDIRCAAVTAIGAVKDPRLMPVLIDRLVDEPARAAAENVLIAGGDEALRALSSALEDRRHGSALRWRIPRTISAFDPSRAAPVLLARLPNEEDGSVRYQIIRALERIARRHPRLILDRAILQRVAEQTASRAFHWLELRITLGRGTQHHQTPGHALLSRFFADKEKDAIERLFRLLGLAHPHEDFIEIYRGLERGKQARATSMELIDHLLEEPLRSAVLALADDAPDDQRLARAGKYHRELGLDYDGLLSFLIAGDREAAANIARFHRAELAPPVREAG